MHGPRVVTDNEQAILAVSEQNPVSRGLKAGYHGGAALAEIVIPVAILVPGDVPSHLPLTPSGPRVPTWSVGADATTEVGIPLAGPGGTSDSSGVSSGTSGMSGRAAAADRIGRLLASTVFTSNRERFAAALPAEQIGRLLHALGAGGSLTRPRAAAALGVDQRRVARVLAVVGQVVNIDGVIVLAQSGTEVTLHEGLLYEQFGISE